MVAVTDNNGTIKIDDGNSQWYIKKQKCAVSTQGDNVIIRVDSVHYASYPYTIFSTPTGGSASSIAAQIEVFLDV
jgi:hypothetical protein